VAFGQVAQVQKDEIGVCTSVNLGTEVPCIDIENAVDSYLQNELDGLAALDPDLTGIINSIVPAADPSGRDSCNLGICDTTLQCGAPLKSVMGMANNGASDGEAFFLTQAWDIVNPDMADEFVIPNGGNDVLPDELPGGAVAPGGCDSSDPSVPADCAGVDHLPIAAASGNTTCVAGGDLPCVLCPALADASSNAECDGTAVKGRVVFLSDEYVVQDADSGILGNRAGTNRYAKCTELGGCASDIPAVLEDVGARAVECGGRLQNYKCYSAKPEPGTEFVQREVELTDQFDGTTVATVITPYQLCNPVRKELLESDSDESLNGPGEPHLMCYKLLADDAIGPDVLARLTDQFGTKTSRIGNSVVLCQPALKSCFDRAFDDAIEMGEEPDDASRIAGVLCAEAYDGLDEKLAHFNCYQSFEQDEEPFGTCSDTPKVCEVDADCPGFDPAGGGETCVPLTDPVPYFVPFDLTLTDQFGSTLSEINDTSLHCNPLTKKVVDGGAPELFEPPLFPSAVCSGSGEACTDSSECDDLETCVPLFPVPDGVVIEEEQVHYRCYNIDDNNTPGLLAEDPRNRQVWVQDQFGINPIRVGVGTHLCEPAVKEKLEEKPQQKACGLLGIEALLGLVPLALLRRRKERRH
jgi:hypothetical protein